jgi:hypothetical protein
MAGILLVLCILGKVKERVIAWASSVERMSEL